MQPISNAWETACACVSLPPGGQGVHVKQTRVAVHSLRYVRSGMQRSGSSMGDSMSQSLSGVMPSWKRFLSPHWVKMSTQSDLRGQAKTCKVKFISQSMNQSVNQLICMKPEITAKGASIKSIIKESINKESQHIVF